MSINEVYKILNPYMKKYKRGYIIGGVITFIISILILPTPFLSKFAFDNLIPNKKVKELIILLLIMLGVTIIINIGNYLKNIIFFRISNKVVLDIRLELLDKFSRITLKDQRHYKTGYAMSIIQSDVDNLKPLLGDTAIVIFQDILTIIIGLVATIIINWKLALLTLIVIPFFIIFSRIFLKLIRNASDEFLEINGQTMKRLEECLNNIELARLYLKRKFNVSRYLNMAKKSFRHNIKVKRFTALHGLLSSLLGSLSPIIIIGFGGYEIINGNLTIGGLIAFSSLSGFLLGPVSRLLQINAKLQISLSSFDRILRILELPNEGETLDSSISFINKKLSINNIQFKYNSEIILNNASLEIYIGQHIGLVGLSGCGKSTLLKILCGLYPIDSGNIEIDGKIITTSDLVSLRKYIAIVEQESRMLEDTIYNNIRLGNFNASKEEIYEAAKNSSAHEFIIKFPNGYNTVISNVNSLSIGEKQRISIARALVKKPKLLLLDEATSNVDSVNQEFIDKAIFSLPKDISVLFVAHRLNTVINCDKIYVFNKGTISESGTHSQLLDVKGHYSELYKAYNKDPAEQFSI